jgi:hypothetical protein
MVAVVVLALTIPCDARATPIPDQCKDPVFARANPGLCNTDSGSPFGVGGGGGGGSGGVLGGIGKILGGLTGGLL